MVIAVSLLLSLASMTLDSLSFHVAAFSRCIDHPGMVELILCSWLARLKFQFVGPFVDDRIMQSAAFS
jgi:hypothetical protein